MLDFEAAEQKQNAASENSFLNELMLQKQKARHELDCSLFERPRQQTYQQHVESLCCLETAE
jgi:hypothetical protein